MKLNHPTEHKMKTNNNLSSYEDWDDVDMQVVDRSVVLQGKPVVLKLDSSMDIAAYGTVVEVNGAKN